MKEFFSTKGDKKIREHLVDTDYANINSINEIAEKFFYSREHISREFKNRKNGRKTEQTDALRIILGLGDVA